MLPEIALSSAGRMIVAGAVISASSALGAATAYVATDLHAAASAGTLSITLSSGTGVGGPRTFGYVNVRGSNFEEPHAAMWTEDGTFVDLNPPLTTFPLPGQRVMSLLYGADDVHQVGEAVKGLNHFHAILWSGTAASALDLHPTGFRESAAYSTANGEQVGYGSVFTWTDRYRALKWSGTPESVINLHPLGFEHSEAVDTDGFSQVGHVRNGANPPSFLRHAALWHGTADSFVDLHPVGEYASIAKAIDNGKQFGFSELAPGVVGHALMWSGSASSVVDMNPAGYAKSAIYDADEGIQVGIGVLQGERVHEPRQRATAWFGTPESAIDLHQFLPPEFVSSSANAVGSDGTIVGTAILADNTEHAIVWRPVPEPTTALPIATALLAMTGRRRSATQRSLRVIPAKMCRPRRRLLHCALDEERIFNGRNATAA